VSLQEFFYIYAIITMTIYIITVIAVIVTLLYIKKKITEITKNIESKINNVKTIVSHPNFYANILGREILTRILTQILKTFRR